MTHRADSMHVLRVQLHEIRPPIWRDLLLPSTATLETLHHAIQAAMPWTNSHLHEFQIGKSRLGDPTVEPSEMREGDEARFTLADVLPHEGARLRYMYDFGDDWTHDVVVKKVRGGGPVRVECLGGRRAAPPDDCGGTWGYERLVSALRDPNHKDHGELAGWLESRREVLAGYDERFQGPFDRDAFDLEATNRKLADVRVERGAT